jgi:hypothetical protein
MSNGLLVYLVYFGLINITLILLGYWLLKKRRILVAWIILIVSIAGIDLIFIHEHPIIKMLAIIATTFTAMKPVAAIMSYADKPPVLTLRQWMAFAGGWAGMRPQPFETLGNKPLPGAWPMILFGISRVIAGLLIVLLSHFLVKLPIAAYIRYMFVSGVLLVGFSLILHFGLLSIGAGMWRLSGVSSYYLFRKPATSISLAELWGKRWNLAFSEMTSVSVFRPLKNRIGAGAALIMSFIFSGLLHELAISVPVNHGYGLPTLYFALQGVLVLVEKMMAKYNFALLKNKVGARIWVFFWLVVPIPLLFHSYFINEIVWPLAGLKP